MGKKPTWNQFKGKECNWHQYREARKAQTVVAINPCCIKAKTNHVLVETETREVPPKYSQLVHCAVTDWGDGHDRLMTAPHDKPAIFYLPGTKLSTETEVKYEITITHSVILNCNTSVLTRLDYFKECLSPNMINVKWLSRHYIHDYHSQSTNSSKNTSNSSHIPLISRSHTSNISEQ